MSAIQEQTKSLKLNATNIKSVLVRKGKRLKNLRKIKRRILDVNVRQAKQGAAASSFGGGGGKSGGTGLPQLDIMSMGLKFISGIFKFIGLLITGVIVNNLPGIIDTAKSAWDTIKPIVDTVWNVISTISKSLWNFGKWVVSIFNPSQAKDNVDKIEENNRELEKDAEEIEAIEKEIDLSLDDEEGEGGGGGDTPGESDAPEKGTEPKPAATSTTPPSPSKSGEVSKDGTADKAVKDKPPIEEAKKNKIDKQKDKEKGDWKIVDVNEKGFVWSNGTETKTVMPKSKAGKKSWEKRLTRKNNKKQTFIIKGNEVSAKEAEQYTTKATINLIETGRLKFFNKDGTDITPILKKTDIESLGTEEQVDQLTGKQTVTTIIMPMKETKVKKVSVNNGGGGGTIGGSSNPPKTNSNLKNAVI